MVRLQGEIYPWAAASALVLGWACFGAWWPHLVPVDAQRWSPPSGMTPQPSGAGVGAVGLGVVGAGGARDGSAALHGTSAPGDGGEGKKGRRGGGGCRDGRRRALSAHLQVCKGAGSQHGGKREKGVCAWTDPCVQAGGSWRLWPFGANRGVGAAKGPQPPASPVASSSATTTPQPPAAGGGGGAGGNVSVSSAPPGAGGAGSAAALLGSSPQLGHGMASAGALLTGTGGAGLVRADSAAASGSLGAARSASVGKSVGGAEGGQKLGRSKSSHQRKTLSPSWEQLSALRLRAGQNTIK